ncbi:MAG: hypothetical protein HW380_635 [Magnetococcales bacterium]|nr:hypothetical protein [Magnetococcales bacterium]
MEKSGSHTKQADSVRPQEEDATLNMLEETDATMIMPEEFIAEITAQWSATEKPKATPA